MVFGGRDGGTEYLSDIYEYDPGINAWMNVTLPQVLNGKRFGNGAMVERQLFNCA